MRPSVITVVAALTLTAAGLLALGLKRITSFDVPQEASAILGLAAPREIAQGERYVAYSGFNSESATSYVLRLCLQPDRCPVNRSGSVQELQDGWGWVATLEPRLPAGIYSGELYSRASGMFGVERTLERFEWSLHVQ